MSVSNGARGTWASSDDYTGFALLIILAGLAFFGYLAWDTYHTEISDTVITVAHWHVQVVRAFSTAYDNFDAQMLAADPYRVTPGQLIRASRTIGGFFVVPACLWLALLASLCFMRAAPTRYRRQFDLDGLIEEQAKTFRTTAASVGRKLRLVAPDREEPRPSDPSLHVSEWLALYATDTEGGFGATGAHAEMTRQLGPVWKGVRDAAPHVRCLFTVFALHRAQRRDEALALLGDLAESLPSGADDGGAGPRSPLAFSKEAVVRADALLRLPDVEAPALAICDRHGFTAPALMSLLTAARLRAGVLSPAQFCFLKLVDRRLWYALHSLGFPTEGGSVHPHPNARVEAIGARDHWAVECHLGQRLMLPSLDRALASVRAATEDAPTTAGPNPA